MMSQKEQVNRIWMTKLAGTKLIRTNLLAFLTLSLLIMQFVSHPRILLTASAFSDIQSIDSLAPSALFELVSVAADGSMADEWSGEPSISRDGRYVAFASAATNLIPGGNNNHTGIFVRDRLLGETTHISVGYDGRNANLPSRLPSISGDGRYVAYISSATNNVPDDDYGALDKIYVYDRTTRRSRLIAPEADTFSRPAISDNGRYIAFSSGASHLVSDDYNNHADIFVYDQVAEQFTRVSVASEGSEANHFSFAPAISADGQYIAFISFASNLVTHDTNNNFDIFVHDLLTAQTTRVSVASNSDEANVRSLSPSISEDGRYIAFVSWANNLVSDDKNDTADVFLHDRLTGETTLISQKPDGPGNISGGHYATISADGRFVAFYTHEAPFFPGSGGVFIHDIDKNETLRISESYYESDTTPQISLSANGQYLALATDRNVLASSEPPPNFQVYAYKNEIHGSLAGPIVLSQDETPATLSIPKATPHTVDDVFANNTGIPPTSQPFDQTSLPSRQDEGLTIAALLVLMGVCGAIFWVVFRYFVVSKR
jgi:Tol biopolymer transport system component